MTESPQLTSENQEVIVFDEVLDITMVAQYQEQLNGLLNQDKPVLLDAEKVERVDGAGLQLIVAFLKAATALHVSVQWKSVSEVFKKSAELSGLTGSLGF